MGWRREKPPQPPTPFRSPNDHIKGLGAAFRAISLLRHIPHTKPHGHNTALPLPRRTAPRDGVSAYLYILPLCWGLFELFSQAGDVPPTCHTPGRIIRPLMFGEHHPSEHHSGAGDVQARSVCAGTIRSIQGIRPQINQSHKFCSKIPIVFL